ncbi:MAG TPA: fimbria/pilus periplasmic chaperone [Burkholderiaceae bacterium]|nr:fimbria/pilus periplasmic chaperone [Burkholderiaceae bacterium]
MNLLQPTLNALHTGLLVLATALTAALPGAAVAGDFAISPTRIDLHERSRSAVMMLTNNDASPVTIQVSGMRWHQRDGSDATEATSELIVTPVVVTVPPKATQMIRVGLRGGVAATEQQRTYRIIIDEVPAAPAAGAAAVQLALRMSVPLFVEPAGMSLAPSDESLATQVSWTVRRVRTADGADVARLTASNSGRHTARFVSARLERAGAFIGDDLGLIYVLPGAARQIDLPLSAAQAAALAPGAELKLQLGTVAGQRRVDLTLQ